MPAFVLPGSSQGAGQSQGEEQNTKPKPQGFPYKLVWFEKRKKKKKNPRGASWAGMVFLSAVTWMDPDPRAGALSKGKNKF